MYNKIQQKHNQVSTKYTAYFLRYHSLKTISVRKSSCQYRKSVTICKTVLVSADRVINESISYDKIPLITALHLWIASYQQKCKHWVTVCATASIQQMFGHPGHNVFTAARNPRRNTCGMDAFLWSWNFYFFVCLGQLTPRSANWR